MSSSEVALYVGLSLAVAVFLVVLLVALSLLRRRRLPGGYRLTQSGQFYNNTRASSPHLSCIFGFGSGRILNLFFPTESCKLSWKMFPNFLIC